MTLLPDPVVLDGVPVPHLKTVVVPPALRVSDQEGPVVVMLQQKFLLRLNPLDLAKIPPGTHWI